MLLDDLKNTSAYRRKRRRRKKKEKNVVERDKENLGEKKFKDGLILISQLLLVVAIETTSKSIEYI